MDGNLKSNIDAAASGALMANTIDSAYELLENMVANNYQWPMKRAMNKKVVGIHEIDVITTLTAQVATLSKKFDTIGVNAIQSPYMTCGICRSNHSTNQCSINSKFVQYVGNYNQQANNPNSNYFNLGWRNHSNFHGAIIQGPL